MTQIKLSHSAQDRFKQCSFEWKLHYKDKIRPVNTGAPLIFGKAIDEACEDYLLNREPLRARAVFKKLMNEQEINGVITDLKTTTQIEYRPADFDSELLSESDNKLLTEGSVFTESKELHAMLKDKRETRPSELTEDDLIRWNALNWCSLYRKGKFLVNKFMEFADENIEEVLSTQQEIELADEEGNAVTGKADFVVKLRNHPYPVVLDLKTTTMRYDQQSVRDSNQLALYLFYLREFYPGMQKAGYVVLGKNLKKNREKICKVCGHDDSGTNNRSCTNKVNGKRCGGEYNIRIFPEATIQFILDTIPESKINEVIEQFNITKDKIQKEEFHQNFEACVRFNGKIKCAYYEYCRSGSMTGLTCTKKKEENG